MESTEKNGTRESLRNLWEAEEPDSDVQELEMSEDEICYRFRKGGKGVKMLRILAELNAVNDEIIADILLARNMIREKPKILREYAYEG